VDHMSKVHRGAFTDAQLSVLAERNDRTIGPLFESCPLCGVKEAKGLMEDHIVGHLRFVALKCLPPYQDEGSEGSRSERSSLSNPKPLNRSTIKKDLERYLKLTFDDADQQPSIQQRHDGNDPTQSPYAEWGGYRNYISKFPAGLKDSLSAAVHFPPPFIPDDETSNALTPSMDPSTDFIEESLFVGVLRSDRRRFEWGFVTAAHGSPQSLDKDSIIQTLLEYKHKKLNQESIPPGPFDGEEFSSTQNAINALRSLPAEELETEIKSTRDEAKGQEVSLSDAASMNDMLIEAAGDWCNGKEAMSLLLNRLGAGDHITEEVVKAAAGNGQNGAAVMTLLLDRRGDEVMITEEIVKAAARNVESGAAVMTLFLGRQAALVIRRNLELDLPRGLQVAFSKIAQRSVDQVGRELVSAEIQDLFEQTYLLPQRKPKIPISQLRHQHRSFYSVSPSYFRQETSYNSSEKNIRRCNIY
jgi:hypothetical protein